MVFLYFRFRGTQTFQQIVIAELQLQQLIVHFLLFLNVFAQCTIDLAEMMGCHPVKFFGCELTEFRERLSILFQSDLVQAAARKIADPFVQLNGGFEILGGMPVIFDGQIKYVINPVKHFQ